MKIYKIEGVIIFEARSFSDALKRLGKFLIMNLMFLKVIDS